MRKSFVPSHIPVKSPDMRLPWIKLVIILVGIWVVIGGIMYWARNAKPTPEKVVQFLQSHPVDGTSAEDRRKMMEKIANELNQLTYEQRREVRMSRKLDAF